MTISSRSSRLAVAAASALAAFGFAAIGAQPASAAVACASVGDSFTTQLNPGQCITASNGAYKMVMQTDGNLVLRRTSDAKTCWTTWTQGHPGDIAGFYTRISYDPNPPGSTHSQPVQYSYNFQVRVPNGGYHYNVTGGPVTAPYGNPGLNVNITSTGNVWFGYTKLNVWDNC